MLLSQWGVLEELMSQKVANKYPTLEHSHQIASNLKVNSE